MAGNWNSSSHNLLESSTWFIFILYSNKFIVVKTIILAGLWQNDIEEQILQLHISWYLKMYLESNVCVAFNCIFVLTSTRNVFHYFIEWKMFSILLHNFIGLILLHCANPRPLSTEKILCRAETTRLDCYDPSISLFAVWRWKRMLCGWMSDEDFLALLPAGLADKKPHFYTHVNVNCDNFCLRASC